MRLERVEMRGFGAFRDATEIDFTGADFFALVGPTGAGKSTVIDAVCFSLYGNIPRYEDKRLNRYVITLGASEARVSLAFELEGRHYLATRVVRRNAKGAVSTKEARLERLEEGGGTTVLAGAEREMDGAVLALLQLDFDDFTRCVVLPQGEFARFLRAKGEERRNLLMKLLNLGAYTAMGQLAGQRAEASRSAATLMRQHLAGLGFASVAALAAARQRVNAVSELARRAARERPGIEQAKRLAEQALERMTATRRLVEQLEKVAVPPEVRRHGEELDQARSAAIAAAEAETGGRQHLAAADAAASAGPELSGLQTAAAAQRDRIRAAGELEAARRGEESARAAEAKASWAHTEAESAHEQASTALEAAKVAHLADELIDQLVVGEACPVCRQVVTERPALHAPAALAEAKKAELRAKGAINTVRQELAAATRAAEQAHGQVVALEAAIGGFDQRLDRQPDLEQVEQQIAKVKAALAALAEARTAATDAADKAAQARTKVEQVQEKATQLLSAYVTRRDALAILEPPPPANRDLLADWESFAGWAAATLPAQLALATAAAEESARQRQQAAAALDSITLACLDLDIAVSGDVVAVATALAEAGAVARAEVERIAEALEQAARLNAEAGELDRRAEVASTLRNLLRANNFPEWLIAEALELLVLDASARLRTLTNDQFSLELGEQEFMVVDHANADEWRSARTLSGGETFQASLALALALSDQIRNLAAEGAPALDSLFLDEGFGTLDSETLDTVAATIENLGQTGRMVGVVTHVRELALRIPVRFDVRKGARSATVERIGP